MIRCSALPLARYCDLSHVLAEKHPERNGATDTGNTVDGQASVEIQGGIKATHIDARALADWILERYAAWDRKVQHKVALYDPDTGGLITEGTADFVAFDPFGPADFGEVEVVDFKKREQYAAGRLAEPDDNDQTHAYALAEALRLGATSYRTCLLLFGDGQVEPLWSRVYTPETWAPVLERIRAVNVAQPKDPKGTAGPHCLRCYPRLHCPHWVLPALAPAEPVHADLVPVTALGRLTRENAARALRAVMGLEEVAGRARDQLEAFVRANGPIDMGDGKCWRPINMPARSSVDREALERDGLLERYTKKGRPFQQFRIGKAR